MDYGSIANRFCLRLVNEHMMAFRRGGLTLWSFASLLNYEVDGRLGQSGRGRLLRLEADDLPIILLFAVPTSTSYHCEVSSVSVPSTMLHLSETYKISRSIYIC